MNIVGYISQVGQVRLRRGRFEAWFCVLQFHQPTLINMFLSGRKSQCCRFSMSTTPQGYFRPRLFFPPSPSIIVLEPTTAKGTRSYSGKKIMFTLQLSNNGDLHPPVLLPLSLLAVLHLRELVYFDLGRRNLLHDHRFEWRDLKLAWLKHRTRSKYFCKRNIFNLLRSHCVSLANDWDDVDLVVQLLHELNVKRFQT